MKFQNTAKSSGKFFYDSIEHCPLPLCFFDELIINYNKRKKCANVYFSMIGVGEAVAIFFEHWNRTVIHRRF
jgi:hypothetical protein